MPDVSPVNPSRGPIGPKRERALAVGLAVLAAFVAITCGSRGHLQGEARVPDAPLGTSAAQGPTLTDANIAASAAPRASTALAAPIATASEDAPAADSSPGLGSKDPNRLELARFFSDLYGLERRTRGTPVRVLWLGDSHTAADYLTGALRARLQTRFGAGGPGFVRVGLKPYRHSQVHWACDGPWRVEPPQPSRRSPFDDGVFGLGGMRALPSDAPSFAAFEVSKGTAHGQLEWQLWFSLSDHASFRVALSGVSHIVTAASAEEELPGAGVSRLSLTSSLADKLELTTLSGAPRFYGLTVEGSEPGLVLDTVGIDGARVATTLAWGEASFEGSVRARAPSLVAFAFGTNEAFDADKVEKYRAQYQDLLARVRKGAPDVDCLLVGPPDANAVTGGSEPRVAEIDSLQRSVAANLGCGYLSQFEIMGGPGGYSRWASKAPPLARGDRLHLTPKGYETMADALVQRILLAYEHRARN